MVAAIRRCSFGQVCDSLVAALALRVAAALPCLLLRWVLNHSCAAMDSYSDAVEMAIKQVRLINRGPPRQTPTHTTLRGVAAWQGVYDRQYVCAACAYFRS